jgi:RNA polymerase sigma factor (sigma-70 family)
MPLNAEQAFAPILGEAPLSPAIELAEVYDIHAPLLYAIARRKFGVPDADVEGLVHDVFATFLAGPARVRDLRAYLIGGICNASREYWRRQKQDERLFTDVDGDDTSAVSEEVTDSVTLALTLNVVLGRVDERCRSVLMRYYVDDEDSSSIAASIGTSRRNVNYILHVCRKRVRAIFRQIAQHPQ